MANPNPNQIHLEGPNPETFVSFEMMPNTRDARPATDISDILDDPEQQARLLQKDLDDGRYDPDGPEDVVPVCQDYTC